MDTPSSYLVAHIFDLFEITLIAFSVWYLRKQIKDSHEWNRRKTTQETLYEVATGDLQALMKEIKYEFDCDPFSNPPPVYEKAVKSLSKGDKTKFDSTLVTIANRLEIICIAIRHHVIDEDICYDYMGKVIPAFFDLARPLIQERRAASGFQRATGSLELYADRWKLRLKMEMESLKFTNVMDYKAKQIERKLVPSKRPL